MSDDLISRKALLEELRRLESLARDRVVDTPWNSPCRQRYQAQLIERERIIELLENAPTAFDKKSVLDDLEALEESASKNLDDAAAIAYAYAIAIVEKGGIE